jgi:hypothetical protein
MSLIFLAAAALALAAWLRFLFVAKGSTILRVSLSGAVLASLTSLYAPHILAVTEELPRLLAEIAVGLVGLGLTAHWLLDRSPDGLQDGTTGD